MLIARHGSPLIGLDLLPDASDPLQFAAGELRRFLARRTGAMLPDGEVEGRAITLRVAADDSRYAAALQGRPPESYLIDADDRRIYLVGSDPAGAVYAAFDFLEQECGVGFAGLGEAGVCAHPQPVLDAAVQRRVKSPELAYRGLQGAILEDIVEAGGGVSPLHEPRLDWMAQHRMNYYVLHPGQAPGPVPETNVRLFPEVKRRGLKVHWGHHLWPTLVTPEKYFADHPEYFPLKDGKRQAGTVGQLCLCTSNPAVAQVMAEEIAAVLERFPGIDVFSLWPGDGTGACECPACARISDLPDHLIEDYLPKGGPAIPTSARNPNKTARYARFINAVAREVAVSHPRVQLSALFYWDIDAPPDGIELESNIQPVLAHYWRCWRHPLDHSSCLNTYMNRITEEWAARYPNRLVIYDYLMGMSSYLSQPWPVIPRMHADWRRFHRLGIRGATIQSQACHFTAYGPTYAAFARMGWDIGAETDDLARPYYANMFEEASAPAVKLAGMLEGCFLRDDCDTETGLRHPGFPHCIDPNPNAVARFLDDKTVARMEALASAAQSLAAQDRIRLNTEKLAALVRYWALAYRFHRELEEARLLRSSGDAGTGAALERCLVTCREVLMHVDGIGYSDIISRQMLLTPDWGASWPAKYRALVQLTQDPFGQSETGELPRSLMMSEP